MTGPADAAAMRTMMVESQVRPNQVNDRRVLDVMRRLPREAYAPAGALAYSDADIALGQGRYLLAPMLIGRLAQLVMMNNPKHVLVIGAGSGYGAAILAGCGAAVTALEEDSPPAPPAEPGLRRARGKLPLGWPGGGPYDAILIEGAVPAIPPILAAQLEPGGRGHRDPGGQRGAGRAGPGRHRRAWPERLCRRADVRLHRPHPAGVPAGAGICVLTTRCRFTMRTET